MVTRDPTWGLPGIRVHVVLTMNPYPGQTPGRCRLPSWCSLIQTCTACQPLRQRVIIL